MVAILISLSVFLLALIAEKVHYRRSCHTGRLAFGPDAAPRSWTLIAPYVRIVSITALTWSLVVLYTIQPKIFGSQHLADNQYRHVIVVLDASPSMKIVDSGIDRKQTRSARASEVLISVFDRIRIDQAKISVIAVYNGAMPVVIDTVDMEVVKNILNDLPLDYAFDFGKTKLIDGIEQAAIMAKEFDDDSTTIIFVSDGDTIADSGMPSMPPSVSKVLVLGLGSRQGEFLDGHQSRQDSSTLRVIARRLGGEYADVNSRHLSSDQLKSLAKAIPMQKDLEYGIREIALLIVVLASGILSVLPLALTLCGSRWHRRLMPDDQL